MRSVPEDCRALIAVDLGAESCRVSLLRWLGDGPRVELVHRFANAPREVNGHLRWDLPMITAGVEDGLRRCADMATEGVRSIAVDGWAVDYVWLDADGMPLDDPFCYRDPRTVEAERSAHRLLAPERMRALTGVQLARINTAYQLHADSLADRRTGKGWLNLPEYFLARWGGARVAELTNATHTQMVELPGRGWSREIFAGLGLDESRAPEIVPPGTVAGRVRGELAGIPAFTNTVLIAPACHDTASAIAGIPAEGDDWAYLSSGTWSLVGTVLNEPCDVSGTTGENFTNLAAVGGRVLFHKGVNGMWMLRQCVDQWAREGTNWGIEELIEAAAGAPMSDGLLDVDDPELLLPGRMPGRINAQRAALGLAPLDDGAASAPAMARLIFESLAARYADVLRRISACTGKTFRRVFVVGGGSRNEFLNCLTAEATGLEVVRGSAESATIGNFAVQLAALDGSADAAAVARWAQELQQVGVASCSQISG